MLRIITQQNCPNCRVLEKYIEANNELKEMVVYIKREDSPEEFAKLVEEYNLKATPSVISDSGKVLPSANPASLRVFLKMLK